MCRFTSWNYNRAWFLSSWQQKYHIERASTALRKTRLHYPSCTMSARQEQRIIHVKKTSRTCQQSYPLGRCSSGTHRYDRIIDPRLGNTCEDHFSGDLRGGPDLFIFSRGNVSHGAG